MFDIYYRIVSQGFLLILITNYRSITHVIMYKPLNQNIKGIPG